MENLSAGEMAALFGLFWICAFIYIGYRFVKESKAQSLNAAALRAEIGRRAAAKGRTIENRLGEVVWEQQGVLPSGESWTMAYSVGYRRSISAKLDRPAAIERDTIAGQRLEWRCPAIKQDKPVFSFYKRTDDKPEAGEVVFGEAEKLWWRWRLVAQDEALARKAFSPPVCALLEKLPLRAATNTLEDERTSISLGPDGLVFVRGVYDFDADQVDLVTAIAEALAEEVRKK